jgi:hypothetical protein
VALGLYDPKNPRRTYRGEEAWFDLLEHAGPFALRQAFIAAGETVTVAGNLVWFLQEQQTLERHFSTEARVKYRRRLAELDPTKVARSIPGWVSSRQAA